MQRKPVYLSNEFENAVVRSVPGTPGFYVKFKGEKEFKAEHSRGVVAEALADGQEITAKEYENF